MSSLNSARSISSLNSSSLSLSSLLNERSNHEDSFLHHSSPTSSTSFFSHRNLLSSVAKKLNCLEYDERRIEKIWILFCESLREDFVRNLKKIYARHHLHRSSSSNYQQVQNQQAVDDNNDDNDKIILAVQIPEIGEFQITLERNIAFPLRKRSFSPTSSLRRANSASPTAKNFSFSNSRSTTVSGTFLPFRTMIQASTIPNIIVNNSNGTSISVVSLQDSHKLSERVKQEMMSHSSSALHENEIARAVIDSTLSLKYSPIFSKNSMNRFLRNPIDDASSLSRNNVRSRSNSPVVRREEHAEKEKNATCCSSTFDMNKFIQVVETIFLFSSSNTDNNNNHKKYENETDESGGDGISKNDSSHSNNNDISQVTTTMTTRSSSRNRKNTALPHHNSSSPSSSSSSKKLISNAVKLCFLLAAQRCSSTSKDYTLDVMPIGSLSLLQGCRRCWFRVSREFSDDLTSLWKSLEDKVIVKNLTEVSTERDRMEDERRRRRERVVSDGHDSSSSSKHVMLFRENEKSSKPVVEMQKIPKLLPSSSAMNKLMTNSSSSSFSLPPLLSRLLSSKVQIRSSCSSVAVKSSSRPSISVK